MGFPYLPFRHRRSPMDALRCQYMRHEEELSATVPAANVDGWVFEHGMG